MDNLFYTEDKEVTQSTRSEATKFFICENKEHEASQVVIIVSPLRGLILIGNFQV